MEGFSIISRPLAHEAPDEGEYVFITPGFERRPSPRDLVDALEDGAAYLATGLPAVARSTLGLSLLLAVRAAASWIRESPVTPDVGDRPRERPDCRTAPKYLFRRSEGDGQ
jgi:hypothetical protein